MPSLRLLTPLSLLIILVISTIADDSNFLSPQLQDPASLPINFPADFNTDSNSNLVPSGWTAADDGNNDNPSDSTGFLASDEIVSNCAGSAPGETPTPIQRRSRLGKRDGGVCRPQQFKDTAPSTGGATTNERPSRIDKTKPAQPIQLEKIMPVLGEPDSPLCHKYFPGSGSNFAVCHYPYFKTIRRIPLVSVLTPCRAFSFADPCTSAEELWCCATTWPRPADSFQRQTNPKLALRYPIAGYACVIVDLVDLDTVPV